MITPGKHATHSTHATMTAERVAEYRYFSFGEVISRTGRHS